MHVCGSSNGTDSLHQARKRRPVRGRHSLALEFCLLTFFCYSSFKPEDIQPFSAELIDTVLTKLESAGSPEKVAENDFMMKCE